MALLGQGRFREALALQGAAPVSPSDVPMVDLFVAVASGRTPGILPAVGALERMGALDDPAALVTTVLHLTSIAGDRRTTERLLERVRDNPRREEFGPFERALLDGIAARARGERDEARRRFRAFAAGEHVFHRFWGHAFLAALARDEDDCAGAVTELEQTRAVGTAWPADDRIAFQSVMLDGLAACYERLGDLERARERNDELLRRWEKADPDAPILVEAKARRVRLAVK